MKRLDVIIPVRNEAANLPELVLRLHKSLEEADIVYKLIVIDDHSTDRTLQVVERLSRKYPIETYIKEGKPGKAYSVMEGAKHTSSEYLAMIDGDLEYPPEAIPRMYDLAHRHGIVVANRQVQTRSRLRRLASGFNRLVLGKMLLGLDCDCQSGLKVFHRHILEHLNADEVDAWTLDMPLLHRALELGCTIGEVDIEYKTRTRGQSKISFFADARQIAARAVKLRLAQRKVYEIPGKSKSCPLGAGVIYKRRRFITHNRLPQEQSALVTFLPWQKYLLIGLLALVAVSFVLRPLATAVWAIAILTLVYFLDVFFNAFIIGKSLRFPPEMSFSESELSALDPANLPVYSILCPLYREAGVLADFVKNIEAIDWPKDKLDVLLLLEEDDRETREAAGALNLPDYIKVVVVPDSQPKTKPKACNWGLSLARGEYTVIYDAEDKPDPLQLKKAYLGFLNCDPKVVCLQAKLNYYNPKHNLLTRLFTTEYSLWFDVVLPGLQSIETTIPLGGTSNHFRTEVLKEIHGWDAFNVTEDCDLGVRLFSEGFRTAIIDSTTYEEANSRWGSWFRQRSRWIKGYLQTFLVHNRHPVKFIKDHGVHAFIFQLIVGGKNAFVLINPILWLTTICYFAFRSRIGPAIEALYPPVVFYMAVFSLLAGNFLSMYYYMLGCARRGSWWLVKYVYLVPFYWLLMSLAAVKAVYQLLFRPHYWEKTMHGLHLLPNMKFEWPKLKLDIKPVFFPKPAYAAGVVLIASNMLTNFFNFLYNAFLGRAVTLEDFGLISLFSGILSLLQIPTGALGRTVSYQSAYIRGRYDRPATAFWQSVRIRSLLVSAGVSLVWILAVPAMAGFFNSVSLLPFYIFTPVITLLAVSAADGGYLSGNMMFASLGIAGLAAGIVKLASTYILVNLNLTGLVYAAIPLSLVISYLIMHRIARGIPEGEVKTGIFPSRFLATSLASHLAIASFLSTDVILAKHFLDPVAAGQYALLSLTGKIIFFLGNLFVQFVTPAVGQAYGAGRNHRRLFYQLLSGTFLVGLMGYLAVGVFGYISVPWLLGDRSLAVVKYLPAYTLSMWLFCLGTAVVFYHQALKQYIFGWAGLAVVLIQITAFARYHGSIGAFVSVMGVTATVFMGVNIGLHLVSGRLADISANLKDMGELLFGVRAREEKTNGLRILVFNWRDIRHKWAGGAEVYIHQLAKNWIAEGNKVTLFCGNDGNCPRREVIDGVEIIRRGGMYTVYIWAFLYYIFRFRGRYDAVIDSENGIPFFVPLYSGISTFLLVHHVHQNYFQRYLVFPLSLIAEFLEGGMMPLVYRNLPVVTVSESSKRDLLNFKNFREEKITVISPGVDSSLVPAYAKTSYPSFLYLGRIRPYKNVDVAIKAFAEVVKNSPDARLTVAGTGENLRELVNLARRLGISESVSFPGRVDEKTKHRLLCESWVMVQPSAFEGWGITVMEANACGTPVIASDTVGLKDSVADLKTGWLVTPGQVETWASAMKAILDYPVNLKRLSKNALIWSKSFNWEGSAQKFLQVIGSSLPEEGTVPVEPVPAVNLIYDSDKTGKAA
jgi:cellulose synthase/poly-beta-1,6-N-acetylglucosamine synthase-like glycosyltransferase/glycosyltransferase involved in cell wall biosynthesis/O-antigen/teichoic acid export membrane protein